MALSIAVPVVTALMSMQRLDSLLAYAWLASSAGLLVVYGAWGFR